MYDEKGNRRFPRLLENHSMLVRKMGPQKMEGFYKTNDLGLGGCEFTSEEIFGEGAVLEILISLDNRLVRAYGTVVYERRKGKADLGVGVEFTRIEGSAQEMLESLFELEGYTAQFKDKKQTAVA